MIMAEIPNRDGPMWLVRFFESYTHTNSKAIVYIRAPSAAQTVVDGIHIMKRFTKALPNGFERIDVERAGWKEFEEITFEGHLLEKG
jgi:hypothetical protein